MRCLESYQTAIAHSLALVRVNYPYDRWICLKLCSEIKLDGLIHVEAEQDATAPKSE